MFPKTGVPPNRQVLSPRPHGSQPLSMPPATRRTQNRPPFGHPPKSLSTHPGVRSSKTPNPSKTAQTTSAGPKQAPSSPAGKTTDSDCRRSKAGPFKHTEPAQIALLPQSTPFSSPLDSSIGHPDPKKPGPRLKCLPGPDGNIQGRVPFPSLPHALGGNPGGRGEIYPGYRHGGYTPGCQWGLWRWRKPQTRFQNCPNGRNPYTRRNHLFVAQHAKKG